jgi:Kef-type K+ transport system membrane component KefB
MSLLIALVSVLLVARSFVFLAKKVHLPKVIGLLLSGLLVGYTPIRDFLINGQTDIILDLGNIALICLMFIAGLESSWHQIYKEKTEALLIATSAMMIPFLLGFGVLKLLGFPFITALIGGICMSITAEATTAKVLLEFGKLKTKLGATMMATGIVDDLLGLLLFVFISHFVAGLPLGENQLIITAILAFFLGILMQKIVGRTHPHLLKLEKILDFTLIPFFFVAVGLNFDFGKLLLSPLLLTTILVTAVAGKLIGTFLMKPFVNFNWKQLHLIGWAMNSRGAVELAFVLIALNLNLISAKLYSALVVMALFTTLLFPLIFIRTIRKNPKIMN